MWLHHMKAVNSFNNHELILYITPLTVRNNQRGISVCISPRRMNIFMKWNITALLLIPSGLENFIYGLQRNYWNFSETVINWFDLLLLFLFVFFFFFLKHLNFPHGAKIGESKSLLIDWIWMCIKMVIHLRKNWAATHTGQIKGTIWKGSHDFIISFIIIPEQKI